MTTDEKLINRMILHADDNTDAPGLLTGQMGVVVVVANYAGIKSEPLYDHVADFLYDCAINHVTTATGIGFASGLAGICWGVEYLIQSGLMPGSGDEICEDLDKRIMRYDIRRIDDFSLNEGLLGLWHYVWARIQGNMKAGLPLPFDRRYLSDWESVLTTNADKFPDGALGRLRAAVNDGNLQESRLDFMQFIKPMESVPESNLSLASGIAGYIAHKYLR